MRQTQILRVHKRRVVAEPAAVAVPVAAVSDTTEAAALIETVDALLAEIDAVTR